jgi:hypothetical protein
MMVAMVVAHDSSINLMMIAILVSEVEVLIV